jgi:hypothetical protein
VPTRGTSHWGHPLRVERRAGISALVMGGTRHAPAPGLSNLKPTLMERRGIIAIDLIKAWDHPEVIQSHCGEPRLGRREHPRACTRVRNFEFEVGILVRLSLGLQAASGNETRPVLKRLSVRVRQCPGRLWRAGLACAAMTAARPILPILQHLHPGTISAPAGATGLWATSRYDTYLLVPIHSRII